MTAEEIAITLEISFFAVRKNLNGLLHQQEVEKRPLSKQEVEEQGKRYSGKNMTWRLRK